MNGNIVGILKWLAFVAILWVLSPPLAAITIGIALLTLPIWIIWVPAIWLIGDN